MAVTIADVSHLFGHIGSFNPVMLVHGEQKVVLHRELPLSGEVTTRSEVSAIWDKGKGAVIEITARSVDAATGALRAWLTTSLSAMSVAADGTEVGTAPHDRPSIVELWSLPYAQ